MRRTLDTVQKDEKAAVLEDDSRLCQLAPWSAQASVWVNHNGEAGKIAPTYWQAMQRAERLTQQDCKFNGASSLQLKPAFPVPLNTTVPDLPSAAPDGDVTPGQIIRSAQAGLTEVGLRITPENVGRRPSAGRRFAIASIGAAMIGASLFGMYFRVDVAASLDQHTAWVGQLTRGINIPWLDKNHLSSVFNRALAQRMEVASDHSSIAPTRGALTVEEATATLPTAAVSIEPLAVKPELTTNAAQNPAARAETREPAATSSYELASAQRDFPALSGETVAEAQQITQAAETAAAELRQSLQREHGRAEALASALETLQLNVRADVERFGRTRDELQQALDRERNNRLAMEGQLSKVRQNLEFQTAQLSKASNEIAQLRKAKAAKTDRYRRSSARARQRSAARE